MIKVPRSVDDWAAVIIAGLLQAGMILMIATPVGVQAWAAFSVAIMVACIAPKDVLQRAKTLLSGNGIKRKGTDE